MKSSDGTAVGIYLDKKLFGIETTDSSSSSSSLFLALAAVLVVYTWLAWNRIPYSAVTLKVACRAIMENASIIFIAFFILIVIASWTLLFLSALTGILDQESQDCKLPYGQIHCRIPEEVSYSILCISFAFFVETLHSCMKVTIANIVGLWWKQGEKPNKCCNADVVFSFTRSVTWTIGSSSMGSFIVIILQLISEAISEIRGPRDGVWEYVNCLNPMNYCHVCVRCIDPLLDWIDSLVEYFNKWGE